MAEQPEAPPRPPAGSRVRATLVAGLKLLLTVVVTAFILDRVGLGLEELDRLDTSGLGLSVPLLFASGAVLLAGYLASAAIWARMVADLGGPRLALLAAAEVYFVANLGRYLPGKLWQVAGLAVLALRKGVPAPVSTAAAVLGQAVALGGAALVGAGALGAGRGALGGWALAVLGVLAFSLAFALVPALSRGAVSLWFRLARRGEAALHPPVRTTLGWLALYTLNWTLYASAFVVLVKSLGLPGNALELGSAFAAAYVLGYVALFAPAGIGVRESFLVLFLAPVVGAGPAAVLAVVARLWTTVVELLPAAAFWAMGIQRGAGRRAS